MPQLGLDNMYVSRAHLFQVDIMRTIEKPFIRAGTLSILLNKLAS